MLNRKMLKLTILAFSLFIFSCARHNIKKISDYEFDNAVITQDTVLSGSITIKGSLIVKKSANLTILPGTIIRFKKFLKDADDISDSDIYVEGSIHAVGTEDNPILFTSAEKKPTMNDWKYLMVNFGRKSELKHCIVEYAFSGVQIHFTEAKITKSVFRNNRDGVRFSTAKITVKDNNIYDNVNGIRYEERKAPALITQNNITNNKIGIFCVIKSDDASTITNNNIFNNTDYNVKLGLDQSSDITLKNNYWGSVDEKEIKNKLFDKDFDDTLGQIIYSPYLKRQIKTYKPKQPHTQLQ